MNVQPLADLPCAKRKRGLSLISRSEQGFTLLLLLIVVAIMGAGLAAFGELTSHAAQRERERELIFAGQQYREAIAAYYERTPGVAKRYPQKLEDLLADQRFPDTRRYLRKLYRDPMTGSSDWGLVAAPGGGIMGVYSRSEAAPIKTGGFEPAEASFAGAARYADWQFLHNPSPTGLRPPR
jgi:type II secretory pathway pseudopilin PulG